MKPYTLSLLSALPCLLMLHAASAATATDTQTLTLTVPLVALIDVEDISPSFTFTAPTNAGEGFTGSTTPANNKPFVAISSNNNLAKLQAHTDVNLNLYNLQLEISDINGLPTNFDTVLSTTPTTLTNIGMMKTSNAQIKIAARGTNSGGMIPYGTFNANIIYTLTQN